ncbi:MAG: hypothetical protein ABR510_11425 [Trueperaceae bacterium]
MKRTWVWLGMVLVSVAAMGFLVAVWAEDPIATGVVAGPHEAHQIVCAILEDDSRMDDGIMHIRNRKLASVVLSDHVAHAGTGTIVSSADIDTVNGRFVYAGNLEIRPDALDGYWTGVFTMVMDGDGLRGQSVLHGNGPDLEGLYVVADLTPLPPAELAGFADACGGNPPIAGTRAVGAYYRLRP